MRSVALGLMLCIACLPALGIAWAQAKTGRGATEHPPGGSRVAPAGGVRPSD